MSATWRAEPGSDSYDEVRSQILEATERHVAQHGLLRVRIEEVAEEAGCSRATIYRYFDDKDELVRQVLVRRARLLARKLARNINRVDDPADQLVRGIQQGIAEIRGDKYFESFYGPAAVGTTAQIASGSDALHALVAEALEPLFDFAESTGRLRAGVDLDEATEWTMLIAMALLTIPPRVNRSEQEGADFLRAFLVPSLFE